MANWHASRSDIRTYVVYGNQHEAGYSIYRKNGDKSLSFFRSFQDPEYLVEEKLTDLIRTHMSMRTGIPG